MKKALPTLFLTASVLDLATTYIARKRFGRHFHELSPYARELLKGGGFSRMACAKGAGTLLGLAFYNHKMQSAKTKEDESLAVQGFTLATCLLWMVTTWNSFVLFKHWKQHDSAQKGPAMAGPFLSRGIIVLMEYMPRYITPTRLRLNKRLFFTLKMKININFFSS